jgi:hypothetical protein
VSEFAVRHIGHHVVFNAHKFLVDKFGCSAYVLRVIAAYGFAVPGEEAVGKWFQRGRVPGEWLPLLLSVLELEEGQPVSLLPYMRG